MEVDEREANGLAPAASQIECKELRPGCALIEKCHATEAKRPSTPKTHRQVQN